MVWSLVIGSAKGRLGAHLTIAFLKKGLDNSLVYIQTAIAGLSILAPERNEND